jgi:hypothetical protein
MPIGGDIKEISFSHPTIGSGTLFPKAAEDSTIDLGGYRSADEAQMVDGGGNMIDQITRSRWSVETTISNDTLVKQELEKLVRLAADPVQADWTISHISGAVYGGKGKPVGDLQANFNQATIALKLSGGGSLKKIFG